MGTLSKYRVELRGENYLLSHIDKEHKCGFYTTVWVEAFNTDDAFSKAADIIRNQKELNSKLLNSQNDSPIIYPEEIFELDPDANLEKSAGKTFFVEKGHSDGEIKYYRLKKWWEFWK